MESLNSFLSKKVITIPFHILKFEHDVDTLQYWDFSCFSFVHVWPVDFDRSKLCL